MNRFIDAVHAVDIDQAWKHTLRTVLTFGQECSPRGKLIKEVLGLQVRLYDLRQNVLVNEKRQLNYKFAVAEWLWIQAGFNDVETISRYNRVIADFSDDGEIFYGAYGPRLARQWDYIIATLSRDHDSRQAVATIYDPRPPATKDVPCTLSLQWLIRENKLHCAATMRSSDLWLGLPYDIFNFSQLTNALAGQLGLDTGSLVITLGSAHLYEPDWKMAKECEQLSPISLTSPKLPGFVTYEHARSMLDRTTLERGQVEPTYNFYRRALNSKTKADALEVLREASKHR